jgi:hypothetical protein
LVGDERDGKKEIERDKMAVISETYILERKPQRRDLMI